MNRVIQVILLLYGFEGLIVGIIPPSIFKIGVESLILMLAIFVLVIQRKKTLRFDRLWIIYLFALILVTVSSAVINLSSILDTISFLRYFLLFLFGFMVGSELKLTRNFQVLLGLIVFSQPIAAIIKLLILGTSEDYIGTISISAGSLATTFTLVVIGYFFIEYKLSSNVKWIGGIFIFSVIAYAGDKRVYWFIAPLMIFLLNRIINQKRVNVRQVVILTFALSSSIYLGARMLPSLNPSHKFWGEWDSDYLTEYVVSYTSGTSRQGLGIGRIGSQAAMYRNLKSGGQIRKVFGAGPDTFIDKSNDDKVQNDFGVYLLSHFTGIMFYMGSIGILGSLIYLLFLLTSLKLTFKFRRVEPRISLFLTHTYVVMIWDYLFYTKSLQQYQGMIFFTSLLMGYLIKSKNAHTFR